MTSDPAANDQDGLLPEPDPAETLQLVMRGSCEGNPWWRRLIPPSLCSVGLHLFFMSLFVVVTVTFSDQIFSLSNWDTAEHRDEVVGESAAEIDFDVRDLTEVVKERTLAIERALAISLEKVPTKQPDQQPDLPQSELQWDDSQAGGDVTSDVLLAIFKAKCVMCHGQGAKQGLDLRSMAGIQKGSINGRVVIGGDLKNSLLWELVETKQMPPEGWTLLTSTEKQYIKDWILAGAKAASAAATQAQPPTGSATAGATGSLSREEAQLLQHINKHRASNGLKPVQASLKLLDVARANAASMAKKGQLDKQLDGDMVADVRGALYQYRIGMAKDRMTAVSCGMNNFSPQSAYNLCTLDLANKNLQLDSFVEAGIGIANDGQGMVYYYMTLATPAK
jgi:hypothetical protein